MPKAKKEHKAPAVHAAAAAGISRPPGAPKEFGAVKTVFREQPTQAYRYVGLAVEKSLPVKHITSCKISPIGNPSYDGDSVLAFHVNVPHFQNWR